MGKLIIIMVLCAFSSSGCCHKNCGIKQGVAAHESKVQSVVYTCPMHPEVRDSAPGNCPKCGMALEEVK